MTQTETTTSPLRNPLDFVILSVASRFGDKSKEVERFLKFAVVGAVAVALVQVAVTRSVVVALVEIAVVGTVIVAGILVAVVGTVAATQIAVSVAVAIGGNRRTDKRGRKSEDKPNDPHDTTD